MSTSAVELVGLVRVTVMSRGRRADLAVPGSVPVADLLPELAGAVGALDPYLVHAGYRLVLSDGTVLLPSSGLIAQGVEDGAVLTVEAGAESTPPRVYDDVVEAVADAVEAQTRPWDAGASRRTALVAAALLLLVAAAALGAQRDSGVLVAIAAGGLAVLLLAGCAVLARGQGEAEAAATLAWLAVPFAAVAGFAALPDERLLRLPLAVAGVSMLVVGAVGTALLRERRPALLPALVVGAAAAATGLTLGFSDLEAAPVVAVVLTVTVLLSSALPAVALSVTAVRAPAPRSDGDLLTEGPPVDGTAVARSVRTSREISLALSVATGLLVTLSAPLTVRLGLAGTLLGVCACFVVLARTRRLRSRVEVATGMVAALAGLVAISVAASLTQPQWRGALTGVLVATAALLLIASAVPRATSVRWSRTIEVAEAAAVVAMVPLLVTAVGLLGQVRS